MSTIHELTDDLVEEITKILEEKEKECAPDPDQIMRLSESKFYACKIRRLLYDYLG